jgi:hypothetical protein
MRISVDLLGMPLSGALATFWMRPLERCWSTGCTNSVVGWPTICSAESASNSTWHAWLTCWITPSRTTITATGSMCHSGLWVMSMAQRW